MTEPASHKTLFKHLDGGNLFAGGFMIATSLLALWLIHDGQSRPRDTLGLTIISVIFLGIGLMGLWDTSRSRVTIISSDQVNIARRRLVTNRVLYSQELQLTDISHVHYAHSITRGGGLWLVLRNGTRIELATINRVPLPFALWPSGRIVHAKARQLSLLLKVPLMG